MDPLRQARRDRGLSLADVAAATRVSPQYVKAIDDGRYRDLPAGIFARAYVRAFATAVGLDAATLADILPLLPAAEDPIPALRETTERSRRPRSLFLTVLAAVTIDAALLLGMTAAIVLAVAASAGLTVPRLVEYGAGPLVILCATTWVQYFLLLAGIHGRTAGERLCGLPRRRTAAPLQLSEIFQRAASPPAFFPS